MARRQIVRQTDLTSILRGAKRAGLEVARVEIDADGRIVLVSGRPLDVQPLERPDTVSDQLKAIQDRNAARRAKRLAQNPAEAGGRH